MKRVWIWAMVLVIVMMGMSAYAVPVRMTHGALTVNAVDVADESQATISTISFHILGKYENGDWLIYTNGRFLRVNAETLDPLAESLDGFTAPAVEDYEILSRGSKGEAVITLQEALNKLGHMSSSADGDFGGISEKGVTAAQAALGLEETGAADAYLQLLLMSLTQDIVKYDGAIADVDPFAAIAGSKDAVLDKLAEMGLKLKYDDIDGVGMISDGTVVSYTVPTTSQIDARRFEVRFGLSVTQDNDGMVNIAPAAEITCTGVQRPIMQQLTVKSGDKRQTLEVGTLQNSLNGMNAVERASVRLDDAAIKTLAGAEEAGELKLRIVCKYNTYDIVVPENQLAGITLVAQAAQLLNP